MRLPPAARRRPQSQCPPRSPAVCRHFPSGSRPKAMVVPDHELLDVEAADQDLLDETARRVAGQGLCKRDEDRVFEPALRQDLLLFERRRQQRRCMLRPYDPQGVWIEGHEHAATVGSTRPFADLIEHGPVSAVNTVERANRDRRCPCPWGCPVGKPSARPRSWQKDLLRCECPRPYLGDRHQTAVACHGDVPAFRGLGRIDRLTERESVPALLVDHNGG